MKMNARTLLQIWYDTYVQVNGVSCNSAMTPIREMALLKRAIDEYGAYCVIYAMYHAIIDGCVAIASFVKDIGNYIVDEDYAKVWFWVKKCGGAAEKCKLQEIDALQGKWFANASDVVRLNMIMRELLDWVEDMNAIHKV